MTNAGGSATSDVVIVGGGVIGVSSAWWLEQAGYLVTIVERRKTLGSLTTPNALGTIRTQYGAPSLVALAQESLEFYRHIQARLGVAPNDIEFSNPGYLYLTDRADDVDRLADALTMYQGLGVTSSEMLNEAEIRRRFRFAGDSVAGIFHGDGSFVNPALVTGAWAGQLSNTTVLLDSAVEAIESTSSGWRVSTERGHVDAAVVVVAGGPYAAQLLSPFGVDLPVRVTPRYRVFVPDDDPEHRSAPLVINVVNGSYWRPVPRGHLA